MKQLLKHITISGSPYFLLLLFLFACFPAQSQHYEFKSITSKDGLPGNFMYSCVEDKDGFMWFVTNKSVCRFDGVNFKIFGTEEGYTETGAYHIYKDRKDRLWVISFNYKLFCFDGKKFSQVKDIHLPCWVAEDEKGDLWVSTRLGQYYNTTTRETINPFKGHKFDRNPVYNFIIRNKDNLICTNQLGFFETKEGKLSCIPVQLQYYIAPRLTRLKNGTILIASEGNLFVREPSQEAFVKTLPLDKNEVICFYEDTSNQDIWIGTLTGAIRFKNGIFQTSSMERYFNNIQISSIHKSREGIYWFCTEANGIYYGSFASRHINKTDGILNNNIQFVKNSGNDIYFSSPKGEFSLLYQDQLIPFRQNISPAEFIRIRKMYSTGDKIHILAKKRWVLYTLYNRKFTQLTSPMTFYLPIENKTNLYHINNGLRSEDDHQLLTTELKFFKEMNTANSPDIQIIQGDSVFYGLFDTLYYKISKRSHTIDTETKQFPYSLSQITLTNKGTIVLSTRQKGIIIIRNDTPQYMNTASGLASNYCNKIYYSHPNIWVCTDNGLSKILLDKDDRVLRTENYTSSNLLIGNEVNDVLEYNGKVYVATSEGLSFFNKQEAYQLASFKPRLYISGFSVNSKDTDATIPNYTLSYNENNIAVSYAAISFNGSVSNLFKYKLEGADNDFTYTSNRAIQFANLAPGDYRFVVYVKSNSGNWGTTPAIIRFTILKPYWKTWWFITMCGCILLITAAYLTFLKVRSVRKENRFKHQLVQSELRALRLYINPHFIFNSLNSMHMFILKNNAEEAGSYILSFSRIIRLIMKYSSRSSITIEDEKELLTKYIQLEQRRFSESFKFMIHIEPGIDTLNTHIPPLIIQPFVENAIKHGLSGMENNGSLLIEFTRQDNFICCEITDNGIGREMAKKKQLSMSNKEDSTGIRYIEDRLKLLAQDKNIQPVEITDLYDKDMSLGTRVKLLIPIL